VKPLELLDRAVTPDGTDVVLYQRDGVYSIRVDGLELMSSRAHGSEEALARLAMSAVQSGRATRVLVGGLGMGFTLRAVLDHQPRASEVVVAELLPAVVRWNRDILSQLAGAPLSDPRVQVIEGDVAKVIATDRRSFDAIMLDVDNGPAAFTMQRNDQLYGPRGLSAIHRRLRSGGVLGVWSADPAPGFVHALTRGGFDVRVESVRARATRKGPKHTIFVARRRRRPADA